MPYRIQICPEVFPPFSSFGSQVFFEIPLPLLAEVQLFFFSSCICASQFCNDISESLHQRKLHYTPGMYMVPYFSLLWIIFYYVIMQCIRFFLKTWDFLTRLPHQISWTTFPRILRKAWRRIFLLKFCRLYAFSHQRFFSCSFKWGVTMSGELGHVRIIPYSLSCRFMILYDTMWTDDFLPKWWAWF